jgi:hypothetical protein
MDSDLPGCSRHAAVAHRDGVSKVRITEDFDRDVYRHIVTEEDR